MSEARAYVSPKREAKAAATREAILEAFVEQVTDSNGDLSPSKAAIRAGVSVRTVHTHFPNWESQIVALGEWFDRKFYPDGVKLAEDADDLPRYFGDIHANALTTPLTRTLAMAAGGIWPEVRQARRRARLDAIRRPSKGSVPLLVQPRTRRPCCSGSLAQMRHGHFTISTDFPSREFPMSSPTPSG